MNRYDVFLDRGRVLAIDQDSGEIYTVLVLIEETYRKMYASYLEAAYEIYSEESDLKMINLDTGSVFIIILEEFSDGEGARDS